MSGRLKVFPWAWKKGGWSWVDGLGVLGLGVVGLAMAAKYNWGSPTESPKTLENVSLSLKSGRDDDRNLLRCELEFSTGLVCFRLELDLGWDCLDMSTFHRAIQDHRFCKILHNTTLNSKSSSKNTSSSYSQCHLHNGSINNTHRSTNLPDFLSRYNYRLSPDAILDPFIKGIWSSKNLHQKENDQQMKVDAYSC